MKTIPAEAPAIEVLPFAQQAPAPAAKPAICHTLAELIHSLGPRMAVAKQWGMGSNTVNLRMQNPGTATLAELQKLAVMAKLDLLKVLELAAYQLEHPGTAVPSTRRGAPARTH